MASVWSREFVHKILYREDPIDAVCRLCEIWCSRRGRPETPPFGLLPCEFNVQMYLKYQGEVGNGGHCQFFLNPGGVYSRETLIALSELGFTKIHDILLRALAVFPDSSVPKDWEERERLIQSFPEPVLSVWGRLDRKLCAIDGAYWNPLLQYLRDHESEIADMECS